MRYRINYLTGGASSQIVAAAAKDTNTNNLPTAKTQIKENPTNGENSVLQLASGELLYNAIWDSNIILANELLGKDADMEYRNSRRRTPLHVAAFRGYGDIVGYMVKHGVPVDPMDLNEETPLMLAASNGHSDVVKYLVENSANVKNRTRKGVSPLDYATIDGHDDIVMYLIKSGADVNTKDKDGQSPLLRAITKLSDSGKQWPLSFDVKRDPRINDGELGTKYIPTNMTCSGKMGTGCVCADKKQYTFLTNRGNNA